MKLRDENVTTAALNFEEDTLVTGYDTGIIKIWDVGINFALREQLTGFESDKVPVNRVLVTQDNTLYAVGSNSIFLYYPLGCVKLIKPFI